MERHRVCVSERKRGRVGERVHVCESERGRDVEIKKGEVVAERGQKVSTSGGDVQRQFIFIRLYTVPSTCIIL